MDRRTCRFCWALAAAPINAGLMVAVGVTLDTALPIVVVGLLIWATLTAIMGK